MDEHQAAVTALSLRSVMRLLVLAGGAVVGWLLISGGPAQADDAGTKGVGTHGRTDHGPGERGPLRAAGHPAGAQAAPSDPGTAQATPPTQSLPQAPGGLAQRTVGVVTEPVRAVPQQTGQVVDQVTAQAPAPVRAAAQGVTARVEPTLTATTAGIATMIDRTAIAADAAAGPVLQATGLQAPEQDASRSTDGTAPVNAQSNARRTYHGGAPVAAPPIGQSEFVLVSSHSSGHPDHSESPAVPRGPETPATPSTITVGAAVGILVGLLFLAPVLLRRLGLADTEPVPAGPAYPPGSSPD
jgi:hypothetical protein